MLKKMLKKDIVNLLGEKGWNVLETLHSEFSLQNDNLLLERQKLQSLIDEECKLGKYPTIKFLSKINYIQPENEKVKCDVEDLPEELLISAPQLVVPGNNARFLVNATNSRWLSLYDNLMKSNLTQNHRDAMIFLFNFLHTCFSIRQ